MSSDIRVPASALQAAFLDDAVSLEDAVEGLEEYTRTLNDDTHFDPRTGAMIDDGLGFNQADYHVAGDYLAGLDTAEGRGGQLPMAWHLAWARNLRKYGDTQLGGVDKIDRFIARLEKVVAERGETPIKRVRKTADSVKGGGSYGIFRADRDGSQCFGVKMPRGTGRTKDLLNQAGLTYREARLVKGEDGQWWAAFNPETIEETARKLAVTHPALAPLMRAVTDIAPVWRSEAGLDVVQAPAQPTASMAPKNIPATGGNFGYEGAFEWDPAQPRTFRVVVPYDALQKMIHSNALSGIVEKYTPDRQSSGHPYADHRGTVHWRTFDTGDFARVADALNHVAPTVAAGIRQAGQTWITQQPEVSKEAQWRAWALVQRFKHLMDPEVKKDGVKLRRMLDRMIEVLPQIMDLEPYAVSADLGPYGGWERRTVHGAKSLAIYQPFEFKDWFTNGPAAPDPDTGQLRRTQLKVRGGKDGRGWFRTANLSDILKVAQAFDASGNLAMSTALRLAYLTDEISRGTDLRLEMLANAPSTEDIKDPALRAEVNAIGDRLDAIMAPMKLRPFQRIGPAFLYMAGQDKTALGMRAYIGDDMGLGKTVQGIAGLLLDRVVPVDPMTPAIVTAPASVLINWAREIDKFSGGKLNPIPFTPGMSLRGFQYGDVLIVSIAVLADNVDEFMQAGFRTYIRDEAHKFKNLGAARTQAAIKLAHAVPNLIDLSGTPMPNNPEDLWAQLHAIDSRLFPDFRDFKARFGGKGGKRTIKLPDGTKVKVKDVARDEEEVYAELADVLRGVMIRRFKTDVAKELPEKTRQTIEIELSPKARHTYVQAEAKFERIACTNWIKRISFEAAKQVLRGALPDIAEAVRWANRQRATGDGGVLVEMGVLRQVIGTLKVPGIFQEIVDFKENNPKDPILVFVEHGDVARALEAASLKAKLRTAVVIGGVTQNARQKSFDAFQAGELDVLIGSRAMIEGINLQRGADVLFAERWWVPADEEQAEDRVYRIGQNRPVLIRYGHVYESIDDHMDELIEEKRRVASAIVGVQSVRRAGAVPLETVLQRLPPAWQTFAAAHAADLDGAPQGRRGSRNIDDPDYKTGEIDDVESVASAAVNRVLRKLQYEGACVVAPKHIKKAIQVIQAEAK